MNFTALAVWQPELLVSWDKFPLKIRKETEKVPELLTEAAFDNKNATVQKIKDIYINTHRSHVWGASPRNAKYFDRWCTMFSQAPPVWLGADRKLSPTYNPWTSTALLSSAPCLCFPAVPPAAGRSNPCRHSLQTGKGLMQAVLQVQTKRPPCEFGSAIDTLGQPVLLHFKVEKRKKGGEWGGNPAMVNVGQYSSAHVSVWKQSGLIAAGCRGQGGTHRTYRLYRSWQTTAHHCYLHIKRRHRDCWDMGRREFN